MKKVCVLAVFVVFADISLYNLLGNVWNKEEFVDGQQKKV